MGKPVTVTDTIMTKQKQIHPILRIPPPLLFALTFVAGVGLQRLVPLTIPTIRIFPIVGFGMVGCAVVLTLYSLGIFLAAR